MRPAIQPLTPSERTQVIDYLMTGADLASVCRYAGVTLIQLRLEMKRDPDFARAVARAEAKVEILQMNNVIKASHDEKNWRTSVWWLERRTRERQAAEDRALSESDVIELLDALARIVVDEVPDAAAQQRVIERLLAVISPGATGIAGSHGAARPLALAPPGAPQDVQAPDATCEEDAP
jgi:hypothetical protein